MRIPSSVGAIALVLSSLAHGNEESSELRYRMVALDRNGSAAAINSSGTIAGQAPVFRAQALLWRRSGAIIDCAPMPRLRG
jgi:hypothetical protein